MKEVNETDFVTKKPSTQRYGWGAAQKRMLRTCKTRKEEAEDIKKSLWKISVKQVKFN
jgi:hypothetical protein